MDYFVLFFAVLCIAVQFNINKFYQKRFVTGLKDMLFFPFICGATGAVFFILLGLGLYGRLPEFSLFSFVLSFTLAVISTLSCLIGILVVKYGKISVYSVFMMLGGMVLPYLYGIFFLDESLSAARITGIVILICALPFSTAKLFEEKNNGKAKFYYILCVIIFCLNGTVSIISKTHSINIAAVPAENFIFYANIWQTVLTGAAYYIFTPRLERTPKTAHDSVPKSKTGRIHAVFTLTLYAVISGTGFLFQLISAKTIPAVVLYPFVTGGSIVLSTVLARILYKEKISVLAFGGIILSVIGTLLFLIA